MERANYLAVGTFVMIALGLLVAGLVGFGASTILHPGRLMETYVDDSVQGLDVGSPVKNRGVPIGRVKSIGFVGDTYQFSATTPAAQRAQRYVRIVLAINRGKGVDIGTPRRLQDAIASGLRIRVAAQGITGVMYLEMNYVDPVRAPPLPLFWEPDNPVVPSSPSTMSEISDAAQSVFHRLAKTDIEGAAREFQLAMQAVRLAVGQAEVSNLVAEVRDTNHRLQTLLGSAEVGETLTNTAATAANLRQVTAGLARDLPSLAARANRAAEGAERLVGQLNAALATGRLDRTLGNLTQASQTLNRTLASEQGSLTEAIGNLRQAAQKLNEFAGAIREQPSLLLHGTPAMPEPLKEK